MKRYLLSSIVIILSLIVKAQTNTWIGGASGNWSTTANWSLGHYPASTEHVVINTSSNISVDVFVSGLNNIMSLDVEGGATVKLTCPVNNTLVVNGDFTVSSATSLEIAGKSFIKGDVSNNGIVQGSSNAIIELNGVANQNISGAGEWLGGSQLKLTMNNPAGATLVSPVTLKCWLVLYNGKVKTDATNILFLTKGDGYSSNWTDASSASFVDGPMKNVSTGSNFTFPIGKGNIYAPISYRLILNHVLTDTFTAEYIRANPQSLFGTNYSTVGNPEVIDHISNVEYWSVKRTGGDLRPHMMAAQVSSQSFCQDLNTTFIAGLDATNQWRNCGTHGRYNVVPVPPYVAGWIEGEFLNPTNTPNAMVGIFTLATNSAVMGLLPIKLIAFDASKLSSSRSLLSWELADFSSSADKFEIQRAGDGRNFVTIGSISGSTTNKLYNYADNDLKTGVNFYRLKMIDENGKIAYSRTVAIMNGVNGLLFTSLVPTVVTNKAVLTIASSGREKLDVVITDIQGRVVQKQNYIITAGNTNIQLSMDHLSGGVYQVTGITSEGKTNVIRFVKQ